MAKQTENKTVTLPVEKYNELWADAEKWRRENEPDVRVVQGPVHPSSGVSNIVAM